MQKLFRPMYDGQVSQGKTSRRKEGVMIRFRHLAVLSGVAAVSFGQPAPPGVGGPQAPMPKLLQNYQTVTADRLKKPEDGDWLSIRRTYDGWGFSPLNQ